MKLSTSAILLWTMQISSTTAFAPSISTSSRKVTNRLMSSSIEAEVEDNSTLSKKQNRLKFMKNPSFHRRGFKDVRDEVKKGMDESFNSVLVDDLKETEFIMERDGVTVYLAKDFGFCWGVERSIALAYEAVSHYPDKKLHITNELIHNPEVNDKLSSMNVNFIQKVDGDPHKKQFDDVEEGDVVILPAFGASYEEMDLFDKKNVEVVDTTCPWVSKVWNAVDLHQKKGLTSIIHGKYAHEETIATVSFCEEYICVKDMKEAEMVTDYMMNGGDKEEFLKYFENATSKGFDPDTMLSKVGLANQTTMYKKETRAIGQLYQKTMMKKFGPAEIKEHYYEFDTICDATQERQDAVSDLVENSSETNTDFILVVGGWDSSNTAHLLEIPHKAGLRSFHINRADCIGADNTITHRTVDGEIMTEKFILDLDKKISMGVTSGASTPNACVQDSLSQIFMLKSVHDSSK